jgi:broad specificity phosphatase PhoE
MTCTLLRHADKERGSFDNPDFPHPDQPLSRLGRRQAHKLAGWFAEKNITAIYVSAYQRTRQTIEPLAQRLRLVPVVDKRLNEIDNGRVGDMTGPEFQQTFPEEWRAFQARSSDFRFPGGETGAEAQKRIVDFMTEKQRQHADENILVVSHDGLIRLWMCHLFGLPVYWRADFQVTLCGITEMCYQADVRRWKLIRFNQVLSSPIFEL